VQGSPDGRLAGKVAIVTGGASGIGEGMVQALHAAGAHVAVADISGRQDEVAAALGDRTLAIAVDVTDDDTVGAMVQRTVEEFGRLDVICNNAGIDGEISPAADYAPDAFDRVLAVNTRGVYSGIRHAIPAMLQSGGGGSIINTASIAGMVAFPGLSAYCASKGAVIALTRCVAVEYAKAGIRCNAICPGVIETPLLKALETREPEMYAQLLAGAEAMTALGRIGQPAEIAAAAVFLASDEASFLTGAAIPVDGAYTAV
jgi:NAD(P)-dependent dehydrogenase (short-subunit alcohol dehydrogenase family)